MQVYEFHKGLPKKPESCLEVIQFQDHRFWQIAYRYLVCDYACRQSVVTFALSLPVSEIQRFVLWKLTFSTPHSPLSDPEIWVCSPWNRLIMSETAESEDPCLYTCNYVRTKPNYTAIVPQCHCHNILPPIKVSYSQMTLRYPYQVPFCKNTRYGWDFVPYCISKK